MAGPDPIRDSRDWTRTEDILRYASPRARQMEDIGTRDSRTASSRRRPTSNLDFVARPSSMPAPDDTSSSRNKHTRPSQRRASYADRSTRSSVSRSEEDTESSVTTQDSREKDLQRKTPIARHEPRRTRQRHVPSRHDTITEEDCEAPAKYTRASHHRASPAQSSSEKKERHRSPRHSHRRRSRADETESSSKHKRLSGRYYETEAVYRPKPPSSSRRTSAGTSLSLASVTPSSRRSSFLGNLFGSSVQPLVSEKQVKLVECVVCMDEEVASTKAAKLKCGHRMCNSCLKRSFKLSIQDPQHMPPKCCTADHIPLKHVEKLFDTNFKKTWNKKYAEFSTRNRVYCPSRKCGDWIQPQDIHRTSDGRKCGECSRCKTKVCCRCNGKWHGSKECPKDDETKEFLKHAKDEGWQRCQRCKAVIELKEGCNHMTCRCGHEFCMICGSKWKTCDCPWFNYDAVENDRLEHMQPPINPRTYSAETELPSPRGNRPIGVQIPATGHPQNYEEEMLLRRLQEQRDAELARRLDGGLDDDDYHGGIGDIHGLGNHAGHFMNDNYRRDESHRIVPPNLERASSGPDYVSDVNRARGVRTDSTERRRLASRFNADTRRSPAVSPAPPRLTTAATMPVPSMSPPPPVLRRHTTESEAYNSARSTRRSERVVPARSRRDYDSEAAVHAPDSSRRRHKHRSHRSREPPKDSVLAGLTGSGKGMNRVSEWRTYVQPGAPEGDDLVA